MDMSVVHGTVVVGVDGSEAGSAALLWAVHAAALEGRGLTVVHATGFAGAMDDLEDVLASERGLLSVGRSIVREAVREARAADWTVGVESVVTPGDPSTMLVEASETAAMVVLGARGRRAVVSALLGSVSAPVIREAACPVVVVRSAADVLRDGPVVVGVDGTPASTAAVEHAFHAASVRGRPLTVLHATWDLREHVSSVVDLRTYAQKVNLSEEEERLVAETMAGLGEKYPDVAVTEMYRRGDPVHQLVEASRAASLVVVGTRGRRLVRSRLLGSVSRGVVERAECPVAVVRP